MNIPKNVNDLLPSGLLNNILPGGGGKGSGISAMNIPKNPLDAVNDMLPTGMLNNIIPGGGGGTISIILDSPSNSYYAGTVVSGKVMVQMDKTETIRALSVKIKGLAHVTWNETSTERVNRTSDREHVTGQDESVTTIYSSDEEYFSNKFNLLGETELNAGTHTYQFSSPLPPMIPSSFCGENGSIKYTVKATMDRPWKMDQSSELEFKVVTPMDLNYNAVAKEAVRKEVSKSFCCLFCQSGPLTLVAAVPYTGYVAGQSISVAVEADNASNVEINAVVVKLNKTINWICHKPEKREKTTSSELSKVQMEGVNAHGSKSWSQQVTLPADMPCTNIDACSVIKMKHVLQVVAEVGGCHQNLDLEIPLIIGTTPIQTVSAGVSPMAPTNDMDGLIPSYPSVNTDPNVGPQGGYPSAPPESPTLPSQPLLSPENIGFKITPSSPPYPT